MNSESSRSHLIIGVVIESTNLTTGSVVSGKLSLVDLAGSERAAKTGATGDQIEEAKSINRSLSALGDVISALSTQQEFIPYRNNILTLLMQVRDGCTDGGNVTSYPSRPRSACSTSCVFGTRSLHLPLHDRLNAQLRHLGSRRTLWVAMPRP